MMKTIKVSPVSDWLSLENGAQRRVASQGSQVFTLAMLRQQVTLLCEQLLAHNAQRWALCFKDSYLFTVGLLASLHAGKTPIIPGHCRSSVLQEQMSDFDGVLTDIALPLDCPVVTLNAETHPASPAGDLPTMPDNACVVLFTSGSTGKPRQVVKPVSCLDEESRWLGALWGERLQDCHVVASVTHQHMYGLTFCIWLPMALGLSFESRQIMYTEQLAAFPREQRYAFISSPAFLRRLDYALAVPRCQLIVSAGGALPWGSAQKAAQGLGHPIDEIYGSTETGVMAWCSRDGEKTVWTPFDGVTHQADDSGDWWVRSALIPQPEGIRLDDKLAFTGDGRFELCGRHDRILKVEDKRISLSEIERRLLSLPEIEDAVAVQVKRGDRACIGVVLVLKAPHLAADLPNLKRKWRHELHQWLEPVAMPRLWRIVEAIPVNTQSKRAWPQIQELFHAAR